jgi:hypothetical protein
MSEANRQRVIVELIIMDNFETYRTYALVPSTQQPQMIMLFMIFESSMAALGLDLFKMKPTSTFSFATGIKAGHRRKLTTWRL